MMNGLLNLTPLVLFKKFLKRVMFVHLKMDGVFTASMKEELKSLIFLKMGVLKSGGQGVHQALKGLIVRWRGSISGSIRQ